MTRLLVQTATQTRQVAPSLNHLVQFSVIPRTRSMEEVRSELGHQIIERLRGL